MPDLSLHHDPDRSTDGLVRRLQHRRLLHEHAELGAALVAAQTMVDRAADRSRLLEVRDGDEHVGEVWLVTDGEERGVVDLTLTHADRAATTRKLVEELAAAEGAVRLTVTVSPGDLVAVAFAEGGGFTRTATQMRLDLAHQLPAEDVVVLEPMDDATYAAWEAVEVESYAAEREQAGESPERARQVSEEQHAELLPDGLATADHHFFVGQVEGETVGSLWVGTQRPMAFVYDVVVDEAHRRKGYGAGLMRAGALWAQERGAHAIGLNVFGHNDGARALYDRLGYQVTEEFLGKPLGA